MVSIARSKRMSERYARFGGLKKKIEEKKEEKKEVVVEKKPVERKAPHFGNLAAFM